MDQTHTLTNQRLGAVPIVAEVAVKYCLYARKSSEAEERQALSIDSQIKEMLQLAERENLEIVCMKRESHSAKETGQRPIFNEIIEEIKAGQYNGILTWAPDRISRNAGDLGKVVDLLDSGVLKEIRTYGQRFTNSPNEKFLLMILGSQAKLENDNRGVNVKRGIRTRVEMGLWPNQAPTGYLNQKFMDKKCMPILDPDRAHIIKSLFEKVAYEKWPGRKLYHWLRFEINFNTIGNKHLALSNIYRILRNPFYYGEFEYPTKSGNWYKGKHEPLISKELFEQVQQHMRMDAIRKPKEFTFARMMSCGLCGSGFTGEEKYKRLKNGDIAKYIYYGCSRGKDRWCKNTYLREDELIKQLVTLLDCMEFNQEKVKHKFEHELRRFNKFQKGVLKQSKLQTDHEDVNLKVYMEYILQDGAMEEKRELINCLNSKIKIINKEILLT